MESAFKVDNVAKSNHTSISNASLNEQSVHVGSVKNIPDMLNFPWYSTILL